MMMVGLKRDVLPIDRYRDSDLRYYRRFVFFYYMRFLARFTADEFVGKPGVGIVFITKMLKSTFLNQYISSNQTIIIM